ncbi:MAG: protein kinase [Planctomycetota bacterium]|nr:protein kinase [Planctomycetota bacterium]
MDPSPPDDPSDEGTRANPAAGERARAARQELLDEFFDRAVGSIQIGNPIPFPDEIRADPSLCAAAERLADVAKVLCGSAAPGMDLQGYTILSELGRGGMGVVYLARQERLGGRPVAIKVLPAHIAGSLSARARFKAEVMSVAKQRHAGIVSVYDIVEEGETLAYIMEWVDGLTMQQAIDLWTDHAGPDTHQQRMAVLNERLCVARPDEGFIGFVTRVAEAIARALASVHATGVVHRDVKPSNILVRRDGTPLLSDFGLAKDAARDSLTVGPGFLGTLAYAAPEQLRGEELDHRADIFSLGATLYHLLLLSPPTRHASVPAALRSLQQGDHLAALRTAPDLPTHLVRIIERAMAFDRDRRFPSAQHMADAFASPTPGPRPEARRRLTRGGTAAVALLALAGSSSLFALRRCDPRAGPDIWQSPTRITIENPTPGDLFGHAVSGFGDRLLVGAVQADVPGRDDGVDAGRAAIFVHENGAWRQEAELTVPDLCHSRRFGESALLVGDTAIVGAPGTPVDGLPVAGAVYVFNRVGAEWRQTQRITAPVPFEQDGLGYRIDGSGDIVVITSFFRSPAAAKDGPRALPAGAGPAHVFRLKDGRLTLLQTLSPDSLRSPEMPGISPGVFEGGEYIVLAGPFANTAVGDQTGVVYIYRRSPTTDRWDLVQELWDPSIRPYDNFGTHVVAFRPKGSPPGPAGVHLAISAATWSYPEATRVGKVLIFRPEPAATGKAESSDGLRWVLDSEIAPDVANRFHNSLFGLWFTEFDGRLAVFHKRPGSRTLRCGVAIYEPTPHAWQLERTIYLGGQDDDDLGIRMDTWLSRTSGHARRHIVFSAPKFDWPQPADVHQDRGAVWSWSLPAR